MAPATKEAGMAEASTPCSQPKQWVPPYYIKGLGLGVPIYFVAIHMWAWVLIVPGFLRAGRPDFRQIYTSAYMVRTGHGGELYDYPAQKKFQDQLVSKQELALPFLRPAYEALAFGPLSRVSFRTAYFIFVGCNLVLLGVCYILLRPWMQNLQLVYSWLPAAMLLGFYPIAWAFVMGQDSILLLALLIGSFVLLSRNKAFLAGLVIGIGLFKFQIVLPIAALFLLWRRWHFVSGFGVSAAVEGFVSIWVVGISGTKSYIHYLGSISNVKAGPNNYPVSWQMMPNIHGVMFGLANTWLPKFWLESIAAIFGICIVGWTWRCGLRVHRDAALLLLALPCTVLAGHYTFMHDLSILLLPAVVLLNLFLPTESGGASRERWIGRSAALMFVAPVSDSYFPNHTYLVAIAVAVLWLALATAIDTHDESLTLASQTSG